MNNNAFDNKIVNSFYQEVEKEKYHRYKSWEHCFTVFQNEKNIDTLSLHLAFYLASWGMYRGSSGLLQKDYRIHISAIEIILNSKYDPIRCFNKDVSRNNIDLILALKKELSQYYKNISFYRNNKQLNISPTDTLITKIMLGTVGCVPAYDRYFNNGISKIGICQKVNKESLEGLFTFIEFGNNRVLIEQVQKQINSKGIYYPTMKVLDMYFWSIGHLV